MRRDWNVEHPDLWLKFQTEFLPPEDNLRHKLEYMERFHNAHPEYPLRALTTAAHVSYSTFFSHLSRNKKGNTIAAARHKQALGHLRFIHPNKDEPLIMCQAIRVLRAFGIKISINTLRSLAHKNGYRTYKVNQNS